MCMKIMHTYVYLHISALLYIRIWHIWYIISISQLNSTIKITAITLIEPISKSPIKLLTITKNVYYNASKRRQSLIVSNKSASIECVGEIK